MIVGLYMLLLIPSLLFDKIQCNLWNMMSLYLSVCKLYWVIVKIHQVTYDISLAIVSFLGYFCAVSM